MDVNLLFTGGKDSSLSAYILERLGYKVKTITVTFGLSESWKFAGESAEALGYPHTVLTLERAILEEGCEMILDDGYPLNGIKYIHKKVVQRLAQEYDVLCDGSRRDDRTPRLDLSEVRSIEDKYDVEYIAPLCGIGYKTLRHLTDKIFIVETYESSKGMTADYETEIRVFLGEKAEPVFPTHTHTRVLNWKGDMNGKKQITC